MTEEELQTEEKAECCMNCEFIEYRDGIQNYCSEHERYVRENDPPCKAYVENGSY